MTWLAILRLVLGLASKLAGLVAQKQLLDAGEARAIAHTNAQAIAAIDRALAARRAADRVPDEDYRD